VVSQERRDLAIECGDQGRFANAKNILSQYTRFLLEKDEAEKIIADMRDLKRLRDSAVIPCGQGHRPSESPEQVGSSPTGTK
jgi:serine/threonine-protein kinase HipA